IASRHFLLVSAISTGALTTAEAYAQSTTSAEDATGNDGSEIKEIVVTAQKRSERLVDVPISISVVSPDTLASTNSKNLNELSGAVPGIQGSWRIHPIPLPRSQIPAGSSVLTLSAR